MLQIKIMKKIFLLLVLSIITTTIISAQGKDCGLPTCGDMPTDPGLTPEKGFYLYPNPSSGSFTVSLGAFIEKKIKVVVYDSFGRVVASEDVADSEAMNSANFNLGSAKSGLYHIRIFKDNLIQLSQKSLVIARN